VLLAPLAWHTLVLLRDGSGVGRGCVALLSPVVSQGRALPLAWPVRQGQKGPWPAALPLALITQGPTRSPLGAAVVGLGDGEFDGTTLQDPLQESR
jgi:hypothetical protein